MVLGLRSKNRKGGLIQVEYLVHVMEIKPWPPSQHIASVQSVLIQWENGDYASEFISSNAVDGKLEFGEFFRLPVTLAREKSKKNNGDNLFQKNFLEFSLYEQRKDKTTKGQLLGSAVINLAEYGFIKDVVTIGAPVSFKKNSKGSAKSVLYVNVRPFDGEKSSLSKEVSLDGSESVSEITNDGNDEEVEIASFTDDEDDGSSNSSRNIVPSLESNKAASYQYDERESDYAKTGFGKAKEESAIPLDEAVSRSVIESAATASKHQNGALHQPSLTNFSSDLQDLTRKHIPRVVHADDSIQANTKPDYLDRREPQTSLEAVGKSKRHGSNGLQDPTGSLLDDHEKKRQDHGFNGEISDIKKHVFEEKMNSKLQDARTSQANLRSNTLANNRASTAMQGNTRKDMLKHLKSVQLQFDSSENDDSLGDGQFMEKPRKTDIAKNVPKSDAPSERKHEVESLADNKVKLKSSKIEMLEEGISEVARVRVESRSTLGDHEFSIKNEEMNKNKENDHKDVRNDPSSERQGEAFNNSGDNVELKSKVEMLEEELMEAAALEIGLYSVVAEHGSSTNKVHAPARRLARFYLHACGSNSPSQMASAARAIISGFVLVSKACGNDVPRLSFWLSNTIMLRVIVSQAINDDACSNYQGNSSPYNVKKTRKTNDYDEWKDPQTFFAALEKVEAWNFSRIVESIWWQTLTPHMQSTAVKGSSSRKAHAKKYGLADAEQGNFAVDLWKKAFKDACERLCPIRAGGHECGCLPVLARFVMEQLVDRLDVAMFNAILRESAEEMPTDPVSDPISDPKVLPIPAGKSSFGAGAQLKNAVGNWSRWLTDLFGIDDSDSPGENDENDSNSAESETSFKAFQLLKSLSDLMMLPSEMIADSSTRKEICPTFDAPLIKRVLCNFVPDEFNPDPMPESIFQALDSEDNADVGGDSISSFPLTAAPATYSPPSAASLINIIADAGTQPLQRSGSTVMKKCYTSDDELDELDSPIASIFPENSKNSPISTPNGILKGKGGRKVVRYQLLRQVWKNGE